MNTPRIDEAVTTIESAGPEALTMMLDKIVQRLVGERHRIPNDIRLEVERSMVKVQSSRRRR